MPGGFRSPARRRNCKDRHPEQSRPPGYSARLGRAHRGDVAPNPPGRQSSGHPASLSRDSRDSVKHHPSPSSSEPGPARIPSRRRRPGFSAGHPPRIASRFHPRGSGHRMGGGHGWIAEGGASREWSSGACHERLQRQAVSIPPPSIPPPRGPRSVPSGLCPALKAPQPLPAAFGGRSGCASREGAARGDACMIFLAIRDRCCQNGLPNKDQIPRPIQFRKEHSALRS
jgi:hypothetical protein